MQIKTTQFINGYTEGKDNWDPNTAQVAFYGRSNVGKSSTINSITNNKNLAKTSSTPGKTQQANFFLINEDFYLVDLPGYGYAKLSKAKRLTISYLIHWYITQTRCANRIHVMVLDAKVGITEHDQNVLRILKDTKEPIIILVNKIDKLNQSGLSKILRDTKVSAPDCTVVLGYSAFKHKGRDKFLALLEELLKTEK